jgi:hypothetical protein
LGVQQERVAAQSELDPKQLRRTAVRIVRPVKPAFAAQVLHVDLHAMVDPSGKSTRQLIDPHLAHRSPLAARRPPQEILAASTGSVYAVLDAQEDTRSEFRDLGRN